MNDGDVFTRFAIEILATEQPDFTWDEIKVLPVAKFQNFATVYFINNETKEYRAVTLDRGYMEWASTTNNSSMS